MEKQNRSCKQGHTMKQRRGSLCKLQIRCGLLSSTKTVKLLANKFDVLGSYHSYLCIS